MKPIAFIILFFCFDLIGCNESVYLVYLNGSSALKLDEKLTQKIFEKVDSDLKIKFMIFIESGQASGVVIFVLRNICTDEDLIKLSIDASENDDEKYPKLLLNVKNVLKIVSGIGLKDDVENNLNVEINESMTQIIVDEAIVGQSKLKIEKLVSSFFLPCLRFFIGANENRDHLVGFRGAIKDLKISASNSTLFHEPFLNISNWDIFGSTTALWNSFNRPFIVQKRNPATEFIKIPFCGKTVCDAPKIIEIYSKVENFYYRKLKILQYTLIVISDDDGSNQQVSQHQIDSQHEALNEAYEKYNISFVLNVKHFQRTDLRRKILIFGCDSSNVGDGICQKECRIAATGDDGGDCQTISDNCEYWNINNGKCDLQCNTKKYHFDGGDCCLNQGKNGECIDPKSPYRQYMTPTEYKSAIGINVIDSLIVYLGNWPADGLIGLSTFPWEFDATSPLGGIIIQPHRFGLPGQFGHLIHEMGHILGLWHVHHGISELPCGHPCFEEYPSMETGDLCSDTGPTPKNMKCEIPNSEFSCGRFRSFTTMSTVKNYMGYAGNDCADHFSPQQIGRMHCYIDLVYSNWRKDKVSPTIVPIESRIIPTNNSLKLYWSVPLNPNSCKPFHVTDKSSQCIENRRFVQFGFNASSIGIYQLHDFWKPSQATGPPNAETCSPSVHAWLPDTPNCEEENAEKCVLHIWPEIQTIIERIFIWFTWNSANGIKKIKLIFGDDSEQDFEDIFAFCDHPTSFNIYERKKLKEIQIFINNPFVGIDAIKMISAPEDGQCQHCLPSKYLINRDPPMEKFIKIEKNEFEDFSIDLEKNYFYWITVLENDEKISEISPKIKYSKNLENFCGNGIVEKNEECDDGNLLNFDGCSIFCEIEKNYECFGKKSICKIKNYCNSKNCQNFELITLSTISSTNFKIYLSPKNGPTNVNDLKICEILTKSKISKISKNCKIIVDFFDFCPKEFQNNNWKNYSMTIKADFPLIFPTGLLIHLAILQNSKDFLQNFEQTKFGEIEFELAGILENGKIEEFTRVELNCSENPIKINLLPFLVNDGNFQKLEGIIIKNITGFQDLIFESLELEIDNRQDLWSLAECAKTKDFFDPESGICISRTLKPSICSTKPIVDLPLMADHCESSSECKLYCQEGFEPILTLPTLKCSASGFWRNFVNFQNPLTFCKNVDCGYPQIPHSEIECSNGTTFQKNCTIQCESSSIFIGPSNSSISKVQITCQKNSKWSSANGFCLPICKIEDFIFKNASTIFANCKSKLSFLSNFSFTNTNIYPIQTICKTTCIENHKIPETGQIKIKLICGKRGTWIGPNCVPTTCPTPKLIYTGLYNCTNNFNVNSECFYSCPGQQQTKIAKCLPNGSWSVRFPCKVNQKSVCQVPESTKDLNFHCSKKIFAGQSCTVKCTTPGYDVVKEHRIQLSSGQITLQFTPISTISCTISKQFYPNPSILKCVKVCNKAVQGDGWCDFQNNRNYCDWDNGDCCSSTSRSGKVRFMFPTLCQNSFCRCLDPNANENYYAIFGNITTKKDKKLRLKRISVENSLKKHWIEKLFQWLDSMISDSSDLIYLADTLALLSNQSTKYSQISALNYEMRSLQEKKTFESTRRTMAQTAQSITKNDLIYKSLTEI